MLCKSRCGRTKRYGSGRRRHGRQLPWRRRRGRAPDEEEDDDDDDESCGGGSDNDNGRVEEHLGHRNRGAISALLGPLTAAANGADGEVARLACAATGSSSVGTVGPRARSDAHARDAGHGGGGGGNGDGYDDDYDDDYDDEINSTMLYSLQSSFHSVSVRSLSGTPSTPMTILLPLHIAAIHGVSHEKLAAEGLVDSRERRTSAEFEGDGDILGGYCRREEEDCTRAAAKCYNVEHVTDKVKRVIGDLKAKMGQGGGCRGR
jgi:hypothetical protein